jgi:hypothetical protein
MIGVGKPDGAGTPVIIAEGDDIGASIHLLLGTGDDESRD